MTENPDAAAVPGDADLATPRPDRRSRIPALVARWADHDVSDPGVTLLEVLAFAADALGYYADHVADEAYLAGTAPHLGRAPGVRRAVVTDDTDPTGRGRLRVRVTDRPEEAWAAACLAPGGAATPAVGAVVWVAFEDADPNRPVWLGVASDDPSTPVT